MDILLQKPGAKSVPKDLSWYVNELLSFLAQRLNIPEDTQLVVNLRAKSAWKGIEANIFHHEDNLYCMNVCLWSNWVVAVCHEMVHLKQFTHGELDHELTAWKGQGITEEDYWKLPYEVEAYQLQYELAKEFEEWMHRA